MKTKATRLVLDHAFHVAHLACVHLSQRAIRAYERAGFKRQVHRRNSNIWLGQRGNEALMDALPEEFEGTSRVKRTFRG